MTEGSSCWCWWTYQSLHAVDTSWEVGDEVVAQVQLLQPAQLGEGCWQRGELVAGQAQHLRDTHVDPSSSCSASSCRCSYLQLCAGSQLFRNLGQPVSVGKQNSELLEPSDLCGEAAELHTSTGSPGAPGPTSLDLQQPDQSPSDGPGPQQQQLQPPSPAWSHDLGSEGSNLWGRTGPRYHSV